MNLSSLHFRRPYLSVGIRSVALLVVLILGLVATVTSSAQELPPAEYSASVAPDACEALPQTCSLTFTITNSSPPDSGHIMTDASITAPNGFTVTGAGPVTITTTLPLAKSWTASFDGDSVTLQAESELDGLTPTENLSVPVQLEVLASLVGPAREATTFSTEASGTIAGQTTTFVQEGNEPSVSVVNDEARCEPGFGCETTTVRLNNTSASATAPVGATLQFLRVSVGGSFVDPDGECLNSETFAPIGEAVTTSLTPDDPPDRSHTVTLTLDKTINNSPGAPGAERIQICAVSDKEFLTKDGNMATVGLLPDCPAVILPTTTKCVLSRARVSGKAVIRYFVEPGDPISIPGLGEL